MCVVLIYLVHKPQMNGLAMPQSYQGSLGMFGVIPKAEERLPQDRALLRFFHPCLNNNQSCTYCKTFCFSCFPGATDLNQQVC